MATILIAEDDHAISDLVAYNLERAGHTPLAAYDGLTALEVARRDKPELILLDQMMPGMDGHGVLRELRRDSRTQNIPVIFLTAKAQAEDRIQGLELGADDYVTKPFNPVTLGAKVKALIRRSRNGLPGADSLITAGPFTYNTSTLRFYKNGVEIPLSAKENAMMKLFIDNVNRIFSKDMLYDLLWGEAIIDENAIMVYVNRLRAKIEEDPAHPAYIQTVRGLGYRFVV